MDTNAALRKLPSVDALLDDPSVRDALAGISGPPATDLVREAVDSMRRSALDGAGLPVDMPGFVAARVAGGAASSLRPVINATGVIIHTNLGRAPLSAAAIQAAAEVAAGYSNLEFDLDEGSRGSRHTHVEALLCRVTGAEAALAVNNNASALFMILQALCSSREVIISRGQAVEIGGGFRIPDVMRQSGATLVEVGTTNRTYTRDYEAAVTADTAAILRVHASNFRIVGFAESPDVADLAKLAHDRGILALDDIGSGALFDTAKFGLAPEPTVQASLHAGVDLVLFSGDKLLGGPQAGIIAGRRDLVEALRRHPLARVLRMDKASIAALNATLLHHLRGEAFTEIPVLRMIATPEADVARRARRIARRVGPAATVLAGRSMVGGGSLPGESLPTALVAVTPVRGDASALAAALRHAGRPVVARVADGCVLVNPRTVAPSDDTYVAGAVIRMLEDAGPSD